MFILRIFCLFVCLRVLLNWLLQYIFIATIYYYGFSSCSCIQNLQAMQVVFRSGEIALAHEVVQSSQGRPRKGKDQHRQGAAAHARVSQQGRFLVGVRIRPLDLVVVTKSELCIASQQTLQITSLYSYIGFSFKFTPLCCYIGNKTSERKGWYLKSLPPTPHPPFF